jgi:hypothetical protein
VGGKLPPQKEREKEEKREKREREREREGGRERWWERGAYNVMYIFWCCDTSD